MLDSFQKYLVDLIYDLASLDSELVILAMLVIFAVIIFDAVSMVVGRRKKDTGLEGKSTAVSIDGSSFKPVRNYISEKQGLAGTPDALILEEGFVIPIERKPLARKLRDRYVAQLLVYLRLVEEFEGKKPPYGYLILGPSCRRIKIDNTAQRQAWLQKIIDEMQSILQKKSSALPAPHPAKCSKCDVREACAHRVDQAAHKSKISRLTVAN